MTDEILERVEERRVDAIDRRRSMQTWTYVGAVAAGLIPVFISSGLWPMPIIAMIVYAALAHGPAMREGAIFEFGDAFYYLGFTLSVGSLLAALDPFHLGAEIDAKRIFHLFGLGMLTTIIGVVGRTGLQIFYRTPSETLESTNKRLIEEAEIFLGRIRDLNESIAASAVGTANYLERRVTPALTAVGVGLDGLRSQVGGMEAVAGAMKSTTERIKTALEDFASAYEVGARDATRQSESFAKSQEALTATAGASITRATNATVQAGEQFQQTEAALRGVRAQAVECEINFAQLAARISTVRVDVGPVQESVNSLSSALTDAVTSTEHSVAGLNKSVDSYQSLIGRLNEAAQGVESAKLDLAVSNLSVQLEAMATSLREHAQFMNGAQLGELRVEAQKQLEIVSKINATLDEIVDAATRRLMQIA